MKNKWLKPVIVVLVIAAVIAAAVIGIQSYLASRSVVLTMGDVVATLLGLKDYLIALGVVIVLAIIVAIVATVAIKKPLKSLVRWQSLVAAVAALVIVINSVLMGPLYALVNNAMGDTYYLSDDTIAASEALVKEIAEEGIVLLKNENNGLPLASGTKLNVFGWSSTHPIYGGTGSGSVDESNCISFLQGLEKAGFTLNASISDFYNAYCSERPNVGMGGQDWTVPEPTIAEYDAAGVFDNAKSFSDTAVILIGRSGGENADLPTSLKDEDTYEFAGGWSGYSGVRYSSNPDDIDPSKSYLELSNREIAMVERVTSEFSNVYVIINSANAMELGWLDEYSSIKGALWVAGPGETGFEALGEILAGAVNPSARLVDTYVYDLHSIPAINYVGDFTYVNSHDVVNASPEGWLMAHFNNYVEGIYVGYKFFETAAEENFINFDEVVQYPFGYGLSYTTFEQKITELTESGNNIVVTVEVKNTGSVAGKDVVEVYYTPPYTNGGIEKSSVNLIEFSKTGLLQPGASEVVTVTFAKEDMASYDYLGVKAAGGAYVLEAGDYTISIRSDSHNVLDSRTVTVASDIIYNSANSGARESDNVVAVNLFDDAAGDVTYLSRKDGFANYAEATAAPSNNLMSDELMNTFYSQAAYNVDAVITSEGNVQMPTTGAKNGLTIRDMADVSYDDAKWDTLLDELTVSELNDLIALGGYEVAKVDSIGLPSLVECDGPAAIKNNFTGQAGTAFPCATMIAATWSKELARARGEMMGRQADDMNVVGWYGPAMNVHRTPFSGRNFEYYSEDGVIAGLMGAEEVAGAREHGVIAYIKHFALNDSETNRTNLLATWTNEQAMREIYLKSFELSVKRGGAFGVMTSFNYIGANWASNTPELMKNVLRDEWGFRGVAVTDWFSGSYDGYMMADSSVRAGTTKMLSSQGDPKAYMTRTDAPSTVVAMRNAAHDYLYTVANSNALNDRNFRTPGWVSTLIIVDVVVAAALILLEVLAIRKYLKEKKEN